MRRSSFVHLHTGTGDHKHGPIREIHIGGSQRLEFYQLCLMHGHTAIEISSYVFEQQQSSIQISIYTLIIVVL